MKNSNLAKDFSWLRSANDSTMNAVVASAEDYIEFLEAKEDRLTQLEGILNDISSSSLEGKQVFLDKFEVLLV